MDLFEFRNSNGEFKKDLVLYNLCSFLYIGTYLIFSLFCLCNSLINKLRGLCLMKWPSEILQILPYFCIRKIWQNFKHFATSFHQT